MPRSNAVVRVGGRLQEATKRANPKRRTKSSECAWTVRLARGYWFAPQVEAIPPILSRRLCLPVRFLSTFRPAVILVGDITAHIPTTAGFLWTPEITGALTRCRLPRAARDYAIWIWDRIETKWVSVRKRIIEYIGVAVKSPFDSNRVRFNVPPYAGVIIA